MQKHKYSGFHTAVADALYQLTVEHHTPPFYGNFIALLPKTKKEKKQIYEMFMRLCEMDCIKIDSPESMHNLAYNSSELGGWYLVYSTPNQRISIQILYEPSSCHIEYCLPTQEVIDVVDRYIEMYANPLFCYRKDKKEEVK